MSVVQKCTQGGGGGEGGGITSLVDAGKGRGTCSCLLKTTVFFNTLCFKDKIKFKDKVKSKCWF